MFENADLPPRAVVHSKASARPARPARRPLALTPWLALSFIVVMGLSSGCQTPYESGLSEFRNGQFTVAEQHAKRGLSEDPEDPELNILLARSLVAQKNYRDAEAYAEVAFRSGERTAEAGRILGKIQWELGRTMDAAASWKSAREAQADSVDDDDYQRALESALRTAQSIQNFEKSLEFRLALAEFVPDHPQATPALIHATREQHAAQLMRQGAFAKSTRVYETLLEEEPDNEAYLLTLAQIHEKLGALDTSREVYERYLQQASGHERTQRMIDISLGSGATENIRYYRLKAYESLQDTPSDERAELAMQLAADSYEQNKDEQAKRYIDEAINDRTLLRPDIVDIEIYFRASSLAMQYNRPKHALEYLERGQALAPTNWQLTEQLAGLYTRRARSADVERVLTEFVDNSQEPFEARLLVSRWANARRNFDLAQHFLERALEDRDPVDTQIWLELARIYAAQGRTDRLKVALTNYSKPANRTSYDLMSAAIIYRQARLYKEAEELLIRSQKNDPLDLGILDALASLYKDWSKPEKIEPYYDRWIAAGGKKAADYTMIGGRLIQQGDTTRAITYFRKGAEAGDVEAWLRIATIFSQQRRNIDMREALQHYIDASEEPGNALRSAQYYYRNAGMASDEIEVLETLLSHETSERFNVFDDHTRLAELYLQQGREDAATTLWTDYLSNEVGTEARLNEASKWFERNGNPSLALSVYTRLFQGGNPNPILFKYIGDTYLSIAQREPNRRSIALTGMSSDALERARHFYRLFLRDGSPSRTEMLDFAANMVRKEQWTVAAETYELLLKEQSDNAPLWLNYGEVLLKTGQAKEGIRVLARYAEQRKSSLTDIQRVAEALASAQLYREAQPYFEQIFQSSSAAQSQKIYAFRRLAMVYHVTRRTDEIPALAERYLAQSQNPTEARRDVLNFLNGAGMYAEAVEQITRIRASQGDILGRELAENYFHDGQFEQAYQTFKKVAKAHAYPGDAWVETAKFYAARARVERAEQAFKEAVSAAPENANVHSDYAFFLLRQGHLERGLESLERARARVTDGQREDLEFAAATVLNEIGRFDLSAEIARASLDRPTHGYRDDFTHMLATYQLATQPAEQAQRSVVLLKKSGLPLRTRIQLLMDNGYEAEAAQWLEEAMAQSTYYNASQILQSNTTLLTATGGFDKLEMAFKPLLELQDEGTNANASLGYALMRQGDFARAIPYLNAAESGGFFPATSLLADAYGALGLDAQALQQYQKLLAKTPGHELPQTLKKIGAHLELVGQNDVFIRLLRTQANDVQRAPAAMPVLVQSLIQADQIAQAFDLVHRLVPLAHETSETPAPTSLDMGRDADMALLVGMLTALAEEGYIIEARAILERFTGQLSADLHQDPRLRQLSLRLAASAPADPEAIALHSAPDTNASHDGSAGALHSARVLLINGHFEAAESLARKALPEAAATAQIDIGDLLLSTVVASGEWERLDEVIATIIEHSGNQLDVTKRVIHRLRVLGQDKRAAALAQTLAEEQPTSLHVQLVLARAQTTEDIDAVTRATAWLLQVGNDPMAALKQMVVPHYYQHPAELSRALYAPVLSIEPATLESRLFSIFMDFRAGDMKAARAGINAYLQAVNFDPYAVQLLLGRLDQQRLFVESARVLAPQLQGHAISPLSHLYIGFAQHQIGQVDAAKTELAQYIARSPDAARAAGKVAQLMMDAENFEGALEYAEQAIAAQPDFLTPYYYRGIARVRMGEIETAQADIAKAIGTGVDRFYAIFGAAYHALKAGHDDLARGYLEALIEAPMITLNYPGAQVAIRALIDADRAEMGLEFFEKNYPQIAAGSGNLGEAMLTAMSNLYGAAGRSDRAHQLYETAITRVLAADPLGDRTTTYMNNLAYGYASQQTPNKAELTKGFDLVRRAIAGTNERSSSFLDTLGWLYFRSHDLDRAEAYIRGSLGTSTSPENTIGELLDHIIAIDEARGNPDEASWLYIYRQNLD